MEFGWFLLCLHLDFKMIQIVNSSISMADGSVETLHFADQRRESFISLWKLQKKKKLKTIFDNQYEKQKLITNVRGKFSFLPL